MDDDEIARSKRAAARGTWPGGRYRLGDEPAEPTLDPTEALASMRELALRAWRLTGEPIPAYTRGEMPGRLIPRVVPLMASDFGDFLDALLAHHAKFVVVGAHALAALGVPRATGDLDVLVRADPENASKVYAALAAFGAPVVAHRVTADVFAEPDNVYQLGLPPNRIDVLTSISGVTFDEAWATRVEADFEGLRVPFLGREAFLRNKRASGRAKDLLDIALLEAAASPRRGGAG